MLDHRKASHREHRAITNENTMPTHTTPTIETTADDVSRRRLLLGASGAGALAGIAGILAGRFASTASAAGVEDSVVNVKDYGAAGNGELDDSEAITAAITAAEASGKTVYLPAGVYMIGKPLFMRNGLTMRGAGRFLTTLRLMPTSNGPILTALNLSNLGDDFVLSDVTLDGDHENSELPPGQAPIALLHAYDSNRWHISRCRFMRGRGYGVGLQVSSSGNFPLGPHQDLYFGECEFISNVGKGDGIDVKAARRLTMVNCLAMDQALGFDIRAHFGTLVNCHAVGCTYGMQLRTTTGSADNYGYITVLGGSAEECTVGMQVASDVDHSNEPFGYTRVTIAAFTARRCVHGLVSSVPNPITENSDSPIVLSIVGGQFEENTGYGIGMPKCRALTMRGLVSRNNGSDGLRLVSTTDASISGCEFADNDGWGINLGEATDRISIVGNVIKGNAAGAVTSKGPDSTLLANITDQSSTVASASTIAVPECWDTVAVSGSSSISSVTASRQGRKVTLLFTDSLTVVNGGNLKLKEDFAATFGDALTLVCQGADWYEISRATN